MFDQIRQSHLIVMLTLLMALLISAGWATIGVSSVGAHSTTSQLSKNTGPTPTPMPTPALMCEGGLPQSINHSADSSSVIVRVGDFVWFDGDGDGIQDDDEQGVPDITCAVCKEGASGAPEDITTTDADGAYELSIGVSTPDDYYLICASASDEYAFTVKDAGDDDSVDSDFASVANEDYPLYGESHVFLLIPGQDDDYTIDAGLVLSMTNPTPTNTPTNTPITSTVTPSATATNTQIPSTVTASPTPTNTQIPSTVTASPTPTNTQIPGTVTPSPTPTNTQIPSTTTPSPTPTATSTSITVDIEPNTGGTLTYTDAQDNDTTIDVPSGAVDETTALVYTPNGAQTSPNLSFAGHAFALDAYQNGELQEDFMFNVPIDLTINYSDEDVVGIDEASLLLYYFDEDMQQWIDAATTCTPNSTYQRDLVNNSLETEACHLTDFALFGAETAKDNMIYLPVIQR